MIKKKFLGLAMRHIVNQIIFKKKKIYLRVLARTRRLIDATSLVYFENDLFDLFKCSKY